MTKVIAEIGDQYCALAAKGHATGSETVCAAVSALVYALAGFLENAAEDGTIQWIDRKLESGDAVLSVGHNESEAIVCVYQMAVVGLLQIERLHPDLVEVSVSFK